MSDKDKTDEHKIEKQKSPISARKAKKLTKLKEYLSKQESLKNARKVSGILKKKESERTEEEKTVLAKNEVIVRRIHKNKERRLLSEQRILETEDDDNVLQHKCWQLAQEILQSKQTVIYTGAGISTAASIPDYRGPQGVWTLLQKGEQLIPQDLSDAEPTLTHMCITALQKKGHVTHVVSQNCDGLHLRSGLPRKSLSEVHGNMFIEICYTCKPHREYIRLFDVTENTGVRRHETGRVCKKCGEKLKDTIVHFGERSGFKSPYRWKEAVRAANNCDLILCLGSSLKILKKYSCLWCMDRARNKRPKLVIVNLQWTPKDSDSFLKINGRCDDVLQRVMKLLKYDIPSYSRESDPIFQDAIALEENEQQSTTKKILERPHNFRNIPLKTVPRSRTPSVSSSDSDSSDISDTSSDSSDLTNSDTEDEPEQLIDKSASDQHSIKLEQFTAYANGKRGAQNVSQMQELDISSLISKVKDRVQPERDKLDVRQISQEEKFMLKSEKICNEAKRAMQLKNDTAVNKTSYINTSAFQNQVSQEGNQYFDSKNGFHDNTTSEWTKRLPSDVAGNNESFASYEEKLRYLQTLQSQLQALKQTQQILKERESSHHDKAVPMDGVNYGTNQVSPKRLPAFQNQFSPVNRLVNDNCKTGVQNKTNLGSSFNEINHEPYILKGYEKLGNTLTKNQLEEYACKERKACADMIEEQQRRFEKEKADMKREQENEHRRIYQQFVMQLQVAEQTMRGEQKKTEMQQVFMVQQQIILNKQTNQLQELFRKHQAEQKVLTDALEKRHKQWEAFVQSVTVVNHTGNIERSVGSQPKYDTYLSYNSAVNPNHAHLPLPVLELCSESNVKVDGIVSPQAVFSPGIASNTYQENPSSSQKFTSNLINDRVLQKDLDQQLHSDQLHEERNRSGNDQKPSIIVTPEEIQSHTGTSSMYDSSADKNNVQKSTKIPGFNELVQGIISCDSCAFLKDYGMSKRWCSKCDSLKTKYGLVDKCSSNPIAGSYPSQVGHMTSIKEHSSSIPVSNSAEAAGSFNVTSQYFEGGNPDISYMTTSSHNYLNTAQVSVQQSKLPYINMNSVPVIDNSSNPTYPCQTPTTSSVNTDQLDCPDNSDQELSPVIPYASSAVSNLSTSMISQSTVSISADESSLAKESNILNDASLPVNQSNVHVNTLKRERKTEIVNCVDRQIKAEETTGNLATYDTPFRPRSQSEIIDINESVMTHVADKRHIRSHSHGELLVTVEKEGAESALGVKGQEVTAAKIGKKRKSTANVSVPGWFGKGLNLKKKRK